MEFSAIRSWGWFRVFLTLPSIALTLLVSGCGGGSSAPPTQTAGSIQQSLDAPIETQAGALSAYHIVYNFGLSPDGANPADALISTTGGTLYGTTVAGGMNGMGTFFGVTTAGGEKVRHNFGAAGDGENSYGLFNDRGLFYGTTQNTNATNKCGTVFTITTTGIEHVLHTFSNAPDGCNPVAPVANNYDGNLVGTTEHGGNTAGDGTVFIIIKSTGMYKVQHVFKGSDGANPEAPLRSLYSFMWGTTANGGSKNLGTIFAMQVDTGAITPEHSFSGTDGSHPVGGLMLLQDILYGTTQTGGLHGHGVVFSKSQINGVYKDLYDFQGMPDGDKPVGELVNVNGTFYGVTAAGGQFNLGTIYQITPTGSEIVLHSFSGGTTDGSTPQAGLTLDADGMLYGTTSSGGMNGNGTVFAFTP